jgi:hypothetical protein
MDRSLSWFISFDVDALIKAESPQTATPVLVFLPHGSEEIPVPAFQRHWAGQLSAAPLSSTGLVSKKGITL